MEGGVIDLGFKKKLGMVIEKLPYLHNYSRGAHQMRFNNEEINLTITTIEVALDTD